MVYADASAFAQSGAGADTVSPTAFREAMRELASGVALVTSAFERGRLGCVVTSFISLSLSPPSALVCLNGESATLRAIRASGAFAINILGERHLSLARRFSAPEIRGGERFTEGAWTTLETGAPILSDALAIVDCRLARVVEHATHVILIGAAVAAARGAAGAALVHWRSRFEALA